jgi:hypothetical protein
LKWFRPLGWPGSSALRESAGDAARVRR